MPEGLHEAWLYARAAHVEHVIVESAGLFWLGAELAILYAMLIARRQVFSSPAPSVLALSRKERRRAAGWGVAFGLFCLVVLLRHAVLPAAYALVHQVGNACTTEDIVRVFTQRNREHLVVWASFVTGWVALESAIVYQGWRIFRTIRERFNTRGGSAKRVAVLGTLLMLAVLNLRAMARADAAAGPGHGLLNALQAAHQADAVYRNALYLYLRIAGVMWIGVEWVAAVLLWQGFRMLRGAAEKTA